MQEAQRDQQSTLKGKLYYVSNNYIVQECTFLKRPILIQRNGGGSAHEIDMILKMCRMRIISEKKDKQYELEVMRNG